MENNFVNVTRTVQNILETHSVLNHTFFFTKRVLFGTIILLYYSPNVFHVWIFGQVQNCKYKKTGNYPYCSYFLLSPSRCVSI